MIYVVDFGTANAGGSPVFTTFDALPAFTPLAAPAITDQGDGQYSFDVDWSTVSATSISFKVTLAGIELSDVISSPDVLLPGATTASAGVSSLVGYNQVGYIVGRTASEVGLLDLNPASQAAFDAFGSTNRLVSRMLTLLNGLGSELASKVKKHLIREVSFVTAGGALSYALPADYVEMVERTGWDRSGVISLAGPVSAARAQFLKAWDGAAVTHIEFRLQGNRLTFPVDPGDGKTITFEYYSEYWVQTAASGTGPDADHVTANTDYVLFDPTLVVLGLKLKYLQSTGRDTGIAYAEFMDRLEYVKGKVGGGPTLSLGGKRGSSFIGVNNIPDTGYGLP